MDTKELTAIIIVAMVGCVIVAGFVPVVGESVTATTTFENDGYITADIIDPTKTYTINWDPAEQYHIVVNDVDYDLSNAVSSEYSGFSIAFANDWVLRYNLDRVFICPLDNTNAGVVSLATVENGYTFSATLAGDSLTTIVNNVTNTYNVEGTGLIISKNGEYTLKSANTDAYVLADSHVFGAGRTNRVYSSIAGTAFNIYMDATVSGVVSHYAPNTWTVSNEAVVSTQINDYVDLYKVSKITAIVNDGVNGDATITYNQIFVPTSVIAEKEIHADANTANIIGMIPFILIMGIVLMFVGVVLVRRYV